MHPEQGMRTATTNPKQLTLSHDAEPGHRGRRCRWPGARPAAAAGSTAQRSWGRAGSRPPTPPSHPPPLHVEKGIQGIPPPIRQARCDATAPACRRSSRQAGSGCRCANAGKVTQCARHMDLQRNCIRTVLQVLRPPSRFWTCCCGLATVAEVTTKVGCTLYSRAQMRRRRRSTSAVWQPNTPLQRQRALLTRGLHCAKVAGSSGQAKPGQTLNARPLEGV